MIEQVTIHMVCQEGDGWRFVIVDGVGHNAKPLFVGTQAHKDLRECAEAATGTLELLRHGEGKKGS